MPFINRLNDPDTGGGVVTSTKQTFFVVGNEYVATDGDPVSSHPPCPDPEIHCAPNAANGVTWFVIQGVPVNVNGDADTCGHVRNTSLDWFNVG